MKKKKGNSAEAKLNELICLAGVKALNGSSSNLNRSFGKAEIREQVIPDPEIVALKKEILRSGANV